MQKYNLTLTAEQRQNSHDEGIIKLANTTEKCNGNFANKEKQQYLSGIVTQRKMFEKFFVNERIEK